ncbi:MAG: hypothetical protein R2932_08000 [Caldilineaceae bacterium]
MNSQQNIQVVQDLYTAFGRGDMATILDLLADDVDWFFNGRPQDVPFAGQRIGHTQMIEFLLSLDRAVKSSNLGLKT